MDFNDIKKTWKSSFKNDEFLDKDKIEAKLKIKSKSNTALNKVKRNYKIELYNGSILSLLILVWLYLTVTNEFKYILVGITFIFVSILMLVVARSYSRIKNIKLSTHQLKPALIETIESIEKFVNFSKSTLAKYLLIPFSLCYGMLLSIFKNTESTKISEIISSEELIRIAILLVVLSVIFIPITQYYYKKMFKQHLDELKECLKEFEDSQNIDDNTNLK
jgi:hypothetical protein